MPSKKLGKGLGELLGEIENSYNSEFEDTKKSDLNIIQVSQIALNPYQPRSFFDENSIQELANSIKEHGLLQPVLVVKSKKNYILVAGERRLRAVKLNNDTSIKAIVLDYKLDYIRELSLIENIQREDLNSIEIAKSYSELIREYEITHEELSKKVKKSRSQITNTLRLLQLPSWLQDKVASKELNAGSTKVLIGLEEQEQRKMVDRILNEKLPSSRVEKIVRDIKNQSIERPLSIKKQDTVDSTKILSASYLLEKKNIKSKIYKNELTITFSTDKEIDNFLTVLRGFNA